MGCIGLPFSSLYLDDQDDALAQWVRVDETVTT
jgi:hypothetical protein